MFEDRLARDLYNEIGHIALIDPHSHIDPRRPVARCLDDILGYHYYTELAHSAGLEKARLSAEVGGRERVRSVLSYMDRFDNTAQYGWFLDIARTFLGFKGERLTSGDGDHLCDTAEKVMAQADWEEQVFRRSHLEKVFLTNDFDDPLDGFNTSRYVPCLRTDDLVFHLDQPEVRQRLARATGVEVGNVLALRRAIAVLFEHFTSHQARACAISLPPDFAPLPLTGGEFGQALSALLENRGNAHDCALAARGVFWALAEHCRDFQLPFDLMIGVQRRVFRAGVHQGQDLFDQRTSLVQYAELFNAFAEVTFPISVLSSGQNQELVSFSWIFPNVVTNGHWWYSNIPAYIAADCRARLQAVPKTKQIGYYSDAYKLEFVLPKYNMYRRLLAQVLADDLVRPGIYTEKQALELASLLLRGNVQRIFRV